MSISANDGIIKAETRNISVEGIYICSDEPLPINEAFFMSIRPPNQHAIRIGGKAVWSNLYGIDDQNAVYGVGISIAKISDIDRHLLADLVASQLGKP
jgi:hypothetical protein